MKLLSKSTAILLALTSFGNAYAEQLPMRLWYNRPAEFFEEALPIGNGKMGAMIYGGVDDNTLYLNDITLWTGKPVDHNLDKDAHTWLPKVREALFNEDYRKAEDLQKHIQGPNSQYYQPLATLHIYDEMGKKATNYYRSLSIDSAICRDSYTINGVNYSREYFASNPDKLIAIRLKADKPGTITQHIMLTGQTPHKVKASNNQLTMTGHAVGDPLNSVHFCTILQANAKDGTISATDSSLYIKGATDVTIYIVNETSFNGSDKHPVTQGAPYIETAADDIWHTKNHKYDEFLSRHVADYSKYFSRLSFTLDGAKYNYDIPTDSLLKQYTDKGGQSRYLEMLYMQYGRYLLISCSRTPGVPANLQGLWANKLYSPWRSNYTVNINLEENYWPAEVANLSEMAMPLWDFMQQLAKNGSYVAKNYYGINRGWCSSHNSDLWAMANPVGEKHESTTWSNWNMGLAWLSQALWEHYAFTMDKQFLATTALPILKGATEFCEDWLIENPHKKGELFTAPSTSPENKYKLSDGFKGGTCYGGTADLAIIRELFNNTIAASKICDGTTLASVEDKLQRLHPYTVGKMGDINEWYFDWDDEDFQHRHQSHLIGLYPGHQITPIKTPDLAKASVRSLEIKGDKTTGWSTGWRINLWARLNRPDQAYHIYQKLLTYVSPDEYKGPDRRRSGGTYPNLFDAHPPFQIDGNFGGTAGVCEMLVQSSLELTAANQPMATITLLPALPNEWSKGEIKGIKARGGYTIDMKWANGKVVEAIITASVNGKATVNYNGSSKQISLKAGKKKVLK